MKKELYRIGIIGFGHMHINDVAKHFVDHPRTQIVACCDLPPAVPEVRVAPYTRAWNLNHAVENFGHPKVYTDYKQMLQDEDLDLAIITTEVVNHRQVVIDCLRAGVGVSIEKPMAMNLSDALAMVREAEETGTLLFVNWPVAWSAAAYKLKELADSGVIGRILELKYRTGHSGPLGPGAKHAGVSETAQPMTGYERAQTWWHQARMGGGAMLDYCCYGSLLSHWYIPQPAIAVMGMRVNLDSQYGDADDNAAMIVRFPGAMALLEGTWSTFHHGIPCGPVLYGSKGTLVETWNAIKVFPAEGEAYEVPVEPLADAWKDVACAYVTHMDTSEPLPLPLQMEFNLEAMAILDAGLRSAESGQMELVQNRAWNIG